MNRSYIDIPKTVNDALSALEGVEAALWEIEKWLGELVEIKKGNERAQGCQCGHCHNENQKGE